MKRILPTMKRILPFIFFLFTLPVYAQNVTNPTIVQFAASTDHAAITSYSLGIFTDISSVTPISEINLGKPAPDANNNCIVTISVQSTPFAVNYIARVRAIAGTAVSVWSEPSNPFDRIPAAPGTPVIKK